MTDDRERLWNEYQNVGQTDEGTGFQEIVAFDAGWPPRKPHISRMPVVVPLSEMQIDALESIARGETVEEWEKRWRQETHGTWPPQEPS